MKTLIVNGAASQSDPRSGGVSAGLHAWIWRVMKWVLLAAVLLFVGRRAYELWQRDELAQLEVEAVWLIPAGCVYILGGLPGAWFWRRLMKSFGGEVSTLDCLRAYYCGHLGKYIPGKATVLIIRGALIRGRGLGAAAAALTAACETLIMMGTGVAVAAALAPAIGWPEWIDRVPQAPFTLPVLVVLVCAGALPVISFLLSQAARQMTPPEMLLAGQPRRIAPRLVGAGILAFVLTWILFGLSLGLTIRAVSGGPWIWSDWPVWSGAVAAATAIGFLAIFAPGGIGVREGLLLALLSLHIEEKQAVAAAVLLRLVWIVAEIGVAGVLYYMVPGARRA